MAGPVTTPSCEAVWSLPWDSSNPILLISQTSEPPWLQKLMAYHDFHIPLQALLLVRSTCHGFTIKMALKQALRRDSSVIMGWMIHHMPCVLGIRWCSTAQYGFNIMHLSSHKFGYNDISFLHITWWTRPNKAPTSNHTNLELFSGMDFWGFPCRLKSGMTGVRGPIIHSFSQYFVSHMISYISAMLGLVLC